MADAYEEIDRPTKGYRRKRGEIPSVDPLLLAAAIRTSITGRALKLSGLNGGNGGYRSGGGPLGGNLYDLGYNIHQIRIDPEFYAVYATRGKLACHHCQAEFDMVDRIARGLKRLRLRDKCPLCGPGRVGETQTNEEDGNE